MRVGSRWPIHHPFSISHAKAFSFSMQDRVEVMSYTTLILNGVSDEQILISRDHLRVFKKLYAIEGDTVPINIEDPPGKLTLALLDALDWARRNTSLQTTILSRDDFERLARIAFDFDAPLLKKDLAVSSFSI